MPNVNGIYYIGIRGSQICGGLEINVGNDNDGDIVGNNSSSHSHNNNNIILNCNNACELNIGGIGTIIGTITTALAIGFMGFIPH